MERWPMDVPVVSYRWMVLDSPVGPWDPDRDWLEVTDGDCDDVGVFVVVCETVDDCERVPVWLLLCV
jgi:hypothetical protein